MEKDSATTTFVMPRILGYLCKRACTWNVSAAGGHNPLDYLADAAGYSKLTEPSFQYDAARGLRE